ncbi:MAG: chemotaxis protein CheW, partial [Allosphingosinicella sp.]
RSRVLTVIDALASLEFGRAPIEGLLEAIVVPSGGHPYALLVDSVEDVIEAHRAPVPIRAPVGAGWDRVAIGMVEAGEDLLLLVDPHLLVAGPAAQAA